MHASHIKVNVYMYCYNVYMYCTRTCILFFFDEKCTKYSRAENTHNQQMAKDTKKKSKTTKVMLVDRRFAGYTTVERQKEGACSVIITRMKLRFIIHLEIVE